ncbi:WRKY domain superfamily [Arabidopsis thaliana x Arabidopsis arenosa]|uniref:WRKY domain superfamily n=1 Tax=Arabidopsis thaliana x Arabidopsis arenosa TaxID=1240361 RepID=A0A8T1ZRI4_9BRAS|nr:WRKY domain superfamily [Arabidopsis thaliana x Arabidopsis arenosa]
MEEIMSMIFNGINLVKELELSLSSQESPESDFSSYLSSISTLFGDANERLKILLAWRNSLAQYQPEPEPVPMFDIPMQNEPSLMQDHWFNFRYPVMQTVEGNDTSRPRHRRSVCIERRILEKKKRCWRRWRGSRSRRTTITLGVNTVRRKFSVLDFLDRAYYRCTHQKLYKCPAKKQVQRLDEDPYTFRITYRSSHTCHSFTTSPISSLAFSTCHRNNRQRSRCPVPVRHF